jgi:hypothetical protein
MGRKSKLTQQQLLRSFRDLGSEPEHFFLVEEFGGIKESGIHAWLDSGHLVDWIIEDDRLADAMQKYLVRQGQVFPTVAAAIRARLDAGQLVHPEFLPLLLEDKNS